MAYVLSSVSGNLISAASAGYAPTNSGDVSAIASAYQVVSSTTTQLYAGTAFVTEINGELVSASRAGQAANASMATSAYYDGTGRLISALPDSAAVSAIASSYAESAASSKQDTLTFGYDAEDKISSIDGSALAGGEQVVTSLQYTTSQSGAIVGSTTGDNAGYGNKAFSARYYPDQGWYNYQSATALAAVGVTSVDSTITGNTEYPFEIFMIPYGATNYGNIDYISSVGSYMNNYGQFNDTSDFRIATGMATLSGYSAILDFNVTSLPFNTQYGSPMWGTAGGMVLDENENCKPVFTVVCGSGSYDEGRCAPIADGPKALGFGAITTVSAVSGINELGIAGGGAAGVDSATCSAIASAYAESAVSSVSGNYYTTANESGFLTAQAQASWSESASASPSYIQDKPDLVDIVAGPGIHIDNPDGNTLRVSQSTFGAWENITDQFTWASNATDIGVRCLYNSTLKLLWMQGYVHLNVGTSSTKVCTLPSSMKTQLRISELGMPSTLEEKHGLLSTNLDRTELHFKWVTAPSNKYVGFFLICPMEEV